MTAWTRARRPEGERGRGLGGDPGVARPLYSLPRTSHFLPQDTPRRCCGTVRRDRLSTRVSPTPGGGGNWGLFGVPGDAHLLPRRTLSLCSPRHHRHTMGGSVRSGFLSNIFFGALEMLWSFFPRGHHSFSLLQPLLFRGKGLWMRKGQDICYLKACQKLSKRMALFFPPRLGLCCACRFYLRVLPHLCPNFPTSPCGTVPNARVHRWAVL